MFCCKFHLPLQGEGIKSATLMVVCAYLLLKTGLIVQALIMLKMAISAKSRDRLFYF